MRTIAVTGAASGIGAAIRTRLQAGGARVIGVDLRDAEVIADLADPAGRAAGVAAVRKAAADRLDGVVACAGVGPQVEHRPTIVSLDYFGAQAVLDGLRAALAAGDRPAAVAVASNAVTLPGAAGAIAAACLAGDEAEARRLAATLDGHSCYAGAKRALACWVRRAAPGPAWAGAGIRLNAVAPGAVLTPLLQGGLDDPVYGPAIRGFPIPTGSFGGPDEIATVVEFLLGPGARFLCGSVVFCDGGTDALLRPDAF
jgi:NAD(P)-dependent dehydrogenase (short-subunit alcohol dehydrogenase family)